MRIALLKILKPCCYRGFFRSIEPVKPIPPYCICILDPTQFCQHILVFQGLNPMD